MPAGVSSIPSEQLPNAYSHIQTTPLKIPYSNTSISLSIISRYNPYLDINPDQPETDTSRSSHMTPASFPIVTFSHLSPSRFIQTLGNFQKKSNLSWFETHSRSYLIVSNCVPCTPLDAAPAKIGLSSFGFAKTENKTPIV